MNLSSDDPSVILYRSIMAKYAPDDDPQGLGYLGYQVVMALGAIGKDIRVSPPMICVPRSPPPGTCRFRRLGPDLHL